MNTHPTDEQISQYAEFILKNVTRGSLLASVKQIALIRNRPEGVVRNEISKERCPIPTILDGGRRVATVWACATWLARQDVNTSVNPPASTTKHRGRPRKTCRLNDGVA